MAGLFVSNKLYFTCYRKKLKSNDVQVVYGERQCIWLILGDSARHWVVLRNFGLFYELCYLHNLFFLTMFVPFKDIQFWVIFLIIDSFKVLVLFPLHIRNKYQEYASYVNTDKRNRIYTSIRTQRIKLKEESVSRSTKIC